MAGTAESREARAHVQRWGVRFPTGLEYADDVLLTPAESRLSKGRYLSTEVLEREKRLLWPRVWQVACREESIPEPGDQLPYTIADQEFLVVRQDDGTLKAFHNACHHRGRMIRSEAGNAAELRCPYHGWCWHLDGRIKSVTDRHLVTCIDEASYALREIACETWAGFVFINPAGERAVSLRGFLGEVVSLLEPYPLERYQLTSWVSLEVGCNWKVGIEAFLEAYHVPGIHPKLVAILDDVNTTYQRMGCHHRMRIPYGLPSKRFADTTQREVFEGFLREHGKERYLDLSGVPDAPEPSEYEPTFDEAGDIRGDRNARQYLIERQRAEGLLRGHDYSQFDDAQLVDVDHYLFFPNFVILVRAEDGFILRTRPHPRDPNRCVFDVMRLNQIDVHNPMPVPEQTWIDRATTSLGEVIDQDFDNLPCVQRGLHSSAIDFVTLTANDVRIRWLNDDIDRYLNDETDPSRW